MHRFANLLALCLLAVSSSSATAKGVQGVRVSESVTVRVVVRVPADTPADASVFLAGSATALGSWKADGLKLARQPDGSLSGDVALTAGETLEFKFTRGDWATVEKNADGSERANRSLVIDASTRTIEAIVERWSTAGPTSKAASTVVGTLEVHAIASKALNARRTIRVWLPPGYGDAANAGVRYDVLYMHDGQNCFDRATSAFGNEWEIDETLTRLIAGKKIRPVLVVGIDNGGAARIGELTFVPDKAHLEGGHGDRYAAFVMDEVMPFVAAHYRVERGPAHTYLGGSSLGGLVSLEIARRYPKTFGGVIAMSPSLWWADQQILADVGHDAGGLADTRVWLDMGTLESAKDAAANVEQARAFDAELTRHQVEHHLSIVDGGEHNELAWAKRFGDAACYLLRAAD